MLEGKVDAILMTDSAYYMYVYRKIGRGRYEPEREEIDRDKYYQLLNDNPASYVEEGYTKFKLDAQENEELARLDWQDEMIADANEIDDTHRAFLAMTGQW